MSRKTKDTDYLFITAFLRSRESRLLTKAKMDRMIEAKTYEEAAKVLEECGYDGLSSAASSALDGKIADKRAKVIDELLPLVPDRSMVEVFRLKYDYHNAKVLIKSEASGADGTRLLSPYGRIDAEEFVDAYRKGETKKLPADFAAAMQNAKDTLARTGDPQLADFILDKAYFNEFLAMAEAAGSKFLVGYARLMTDSANLRSAVRLLRAGRDSAFLRSALCEGGNVSAEDFAAAAAENASMASLFDGTLLADAAKAGDEAVSGGSLTVFEKLCDNALLEYLSAARSVSFGDSVLIAYIGAVENEALAARIIMTGKLAGLEPEVIRERLRDSYV